MNGYIYKLIKHGVEILNVVEILAYFEQTKASWIPNLKWVG